MSSFPWGHELLFTHLLGKCGLHDNSPPGRGGHWGPRIQLDSTLLSGSQNPGRDLPLNLVCQGLEIPPLLKGPHLSLLATISLVGPHHLYPGTWRDYPQGSDLGYFPLQSVLEACDSALSASRAPSPPTSHTSPQPRWACGDFPQHHVYALTWEPLHLFYSLSFLGHCSLNNILPTLHSLPPLKPTPVFSESFLLPSVLSEPCPMTTVTLL